MNILVINAGSSSLKYQLFDMKDERVLAKGLCERIGLDGHINHKPLVEGKKEFDADMTLPTHSEAISAVIEKLLSAEYGVISDVSEISAVGHRVVHGGESFSSSVLIDDTVMQAIEDCVPLAPLHNPANITGINACKAVMGNTPQVVVFDTAFHQTIPSKAYIYAIPYEYYEKYKIRRYGFHGTSHRYVAVQAAKMLDKPIENLKLISCHLGNGSSICAIDGGKSVDTSMGFTPLDGIIMGTRSGSVDPSIVTYLMEKENMGPKEINDLLNKKSGYLGVSELTSDQRDLVDAAMQGNDHAQLALDIQRYQIKKYIGAYAAAMGGLDYVVFTGGIGENSTMVREVACEGLGFMGIEIDCDLNKTVQGSEKCISKAGTKTQVWVVPTNEELLIARDTCEIVNRE